MKVDGVLLARARRCMNGSNVHPLKTLMFCYEEAITLHNSGHPRHRRYKEKYENLLREFVTAAELALGQRAALKREQANDEPGRSAERSHQVKKLKRFG